MIIHNLLKNSTLLDSNAIKLQLKFTEISEIFLSDSLYFYLTKSKKRIDDNVNDWDHYKKITNPYEYIHTPIHNNSKNISTYEAISRSFFKMIEISNFYKILDSFNNKPVKSFHLAEGPGGFIEAMMYMRNNSSDSYYGMTLLSDNRNVPRWTKLQNKFKFNTIINYELGKTENGDLLKYENLEYCHSKYANSMDLITGDGGFDFSINYEKQEMAAIPLIMSQIMYAILMQKQNGTFILKIFDIFRRPTAELIYLLTSLYNSVSICKPKTSRFANSEKYIICKGFKLNNSSHFLDKFKLCLKQMSENKNINSIFNFDIPISFIKEIEEINCIFGKKQLNTIHSTLMMIQEKRTDKIEKSTAINIEKCIQWCVNNNIPYQSKYKQNNIFTSCK
jgi:23S rRNA U2552 (ribose-2'-O)-methylase RlmE/FtsJ